MESSKKSSDPVLAELVAIKRLLVFAMLTSGTSQKQIGAAIGVDQSKVSRMFPAGIRALARNVSRKK